MSYFKKIDLNVDTALAKDTSKLAFENSFYKWQKYGLKLLKYKEYTPIANNQYKITGQSKTKILKCIPQQLLLIEEPEVWVFNGTGSVEGLSMLAPHRDLVRLCGINIYFETNNERTIFYDYHNQNLTEVSDFIAKDNDCYILDVDQPHAVELAQGKTRKLISIAFIKTPYSEVIKYF